ncbi:MAG: hypothetical protein P1V36_06780 [Planctomycetota bacterium]|nr:hypothetical protein [Planctomycetota bacterium]
MRHCLSLRLLAVLSVLALAACGGGGTSDSGPSFFAFATFQEASVAVGQADLASNMVNGGGGINADTLNVPGAPCVVGARLFIADMGNNRVLGFNSIPTASGASADFVVGQADLMSGAANAGGAASAGTLNGPWAVAETGGTFVVADTGNHRVLLYSAVPTATGATASVALGQPSLLGVLANQGGAATAGTLSAPTGIHAVGTKLLVCDTSNNRVLIWNTIPTTNGQAADIVLGQADGAGAMANRGVVGAPTANTLFSPFGVWSDGTRVVVADGGNHRVLIWNSFPTASGQGADIVLGQGSFGSQLAATTQLGMNVPTDVSSDGTKLVVGDCENNRVLIYDAFPVASNTAPTTVLGQGVFTLGAGNDDNQDGLTDGPGIGVCTAKTVNTTSGFSFVTLFGTRLFLGDRRNSRIVIYEGM